jgi:hypothetical protein
MPSFLGFGAALAIIASAYEYGGGKLAGMIDTDEDEVSRKEAMRNNRRRSVWETVSELGEGRGKHFAQ